MMRIINTALFPTTTLFDQAQLDVKKHHAPDKIFDQYGESLQSRLKIAIITETWPPEINGVALSMRQLCKGLQGRGHQILLVRPQQHVSCQEFQADQECLVRAQSIPKYQDLKFGWPQFKKIKQAFEQFQPDVVHIVTEGPLGYAALSVARKKQLPVSSGFHSSFHDFSRFFKLGFLLNPIQRYLRWFHDCTDMTCVPSEFTQQNLRKMGLSCPIQIVGRGVDTLRFSPQHRSEKLRMSWGATADTRVVLYVGRVSPEKQVDVVLDGFKRLKVKSCDDSLLVIVGDGPDLARLKHLSQGHTVVFTGRLDGHELAQAYASADVFAFASQVETFGNVVIEAMASGLPVLAFDYACAQMHVRENESGWLTRLGNVEALMEQIAQLPQREVLQRMGLNARRQVMNSSWLEPICQMESALYQAIQHAKSRSSVQ